MALSKGSKKGSVPKGPPPAAAPSVTKWVVVQLTALGEREKNIHLIERAAQQILKRKDLTVFVPAISQKARDESLTTWYSNGYVFVRYMDNVHYNALQDTAYFSDVLSKTGVVGGVRKTVYSVLEDKDLDSMRSGMKSMRVMKVGSLVEENIVKVIKGNYKNLIGKVSMVYEGNENVQVYVDLRSKKVFMDFPSSYLEKVEEQ